MNSGGLHILRLFEKAFIILVLLLSTGIVFSTGADINDLRPTESNMLQQAINLANYAMVFLLLARRANRAMTVASRDPLLWTLVLLACVSVIWSAMPMLTLRRSAVMAGTTATGLYIATRFSIREQMLLLAKALLLAAMVSLDVILLWPERGIYGSEMAVHGIFFRGLYENKNVLGQLMALGALIMLFAVFNSTHRWLWCLGVFLCLGLLALTRSATSMVALGSTLATLPLLALLRWNYHLTLPLIVGATAPGALVLGWLWMNAETVFSVLGKDITFTGRTNIWMAVLDMIWQRPWLGYGFSGFWLGWEGPSASVCQMAGWPVPHAHNGLLDIWLTLGIWGLALFVAGFTIAFFRALAVMARSAHASEGFWPVIFLLFMLIYNMTESTILRPNHLMWILYVAACLSPGTRQAQAASPSPAGAWTRGQPQTSLG